MDETNTPVPFTGTVKLVTVDAVYAVGNLLPQPEGHAPEPLFISEIEQDEDGDWTIVARPDTDPPQDPPEDMDPEERAVLLEARKAYMELAAQYAADERIMIRTLVSDPNTRVRYYDLLTNQSALATEVAKLGMAEEAQDGQAEG